MVQRRRRRRCALAPARRARRAGALRAAAADGRRGACRGGLAAAPTSTDSPSARVPVRSPASASGAAWRRDWRWARTCRSCRFPRSPRSRRRSFACAAGPVYAPASMRGCARSMSPPMRATAAPGGKSRRLRFCRRPRSPARGICDAGAWCGAGNGFAAYPVLAQQLALVQTDAEARPSARAIGELALPRLAAGEAVVPPTPCRSTCATAWR